MCKCHTEQVLQSHLGNTNLNSRRLLLDFSGGLFFFFLEMMSIKLPKHTTKWKLVGWLFREELVDKVTLKEPTRELWDSQLKQKI